MLIVWNEKKTKRASVLVLTETGSVSSMSELPIEAPADASLKNIILTSPRGDFVQLLFSEIELESQATLEAQPSIRKKEFKSAASLHIVEFAKCKELTKYALLGDYICWTDQTKVMCQHLEAVEPVEIDLIDYFGGDDAGLIVIDGCLQKSLIEAGYLTEVNQQNMKKLENYLQVTIDNRILIFDINVQKPTLVKELEESEKMMDP